jgi:hypothetical protein
MLTGLALRLYLEYVIRNVQANYKGLKLNVAQQLLAYADINILCGNIQTETLVVARKEIGLEVNAEKTKYIFMFHEDNAE